MAKGCVTDAAGSLGWLGGLAVGAGRSVWLAWLARLAGLCLEVFPFSGVFICVSLELRFFLFLLLSLFLHVCSLQQGNILGITITGFDIQGKLCSVVLGSAWLEHV